MIMRLEKPTNVIKKYDRLSFSTLFSPGLVGFAGPFFFITSMPGGAVFADDQIPPDPALPCLLNKDKILI